MTARVILTNAVRRVQAEALGAKLAKGTVRVMDEAGTELMRCPMSEKFAVGSKGERIVFEPLAAASVVAKGKPTQCELIGNDGTTVLAKAVAGRYDNAFLRFADDQLYEGMRVEFDEPLILDLKPAGENK